MFTTNKLHLSAKLRQCISINKKTVDESTVFEGKVPIMTIDKGFQFN